MSLGSWGEDLAENYIIKKGYSVLERNFRCKSGEIDIIVCDGDTLVFVEVKTRQSQKYGLPCEAITAAKLRHLKKAAAYFTAMHKLGQRDARIDVIEILKTEGKIYIHHIENITV